MVLCWIGTKPSPGIEWDKGVGAPQSACVIVDRDTFSATSRRSEANCVGRRVVDLVGKCWKCVYSIWMYPVCLSYYVDAPVELLLEYLQDIGDGQIYINWFSPSLGHLPVIHVSPKFYGSKK